MRLKSTRMSLTVRVFRSSEVVAADCSRLCRPWRLRRSSDQGGPEAGFWADAWLDPGPLTVLAGYPFCMPEFMAFRKRFRAPTYSSKSAGQVDFPSIILAMRFHELIYPMRFQDSRSVLFPCSFVMPKTPSHAGFSSSLSYQFYVALEYPILY